MLVRKGYELELAHDALRRHAASPSSTEAVGALHEGATPFAPEPLRYYDPAQATDRARRAAENSSKQHFPTRNTATSADGDDKHRPSGASRAADPGGRARCTRPNHASSRHPYAAARRAAAMLILSARCPGHGSVCRSPNEDRTSTATAVRAPRARGEERTMEIVIAAVVVAVGLAAGLVAAALPAGQARARHRRAARPGQRRRAARRPERAARRGDGGGRRSRARRRWAASRSGCATREADARRARPPTLDAREQAARPRASSRLEEVREQARARARAGLGPVGVPGQAPAAQGARGPDPPRRGAAACARSRRRPSATPSAACATSSRVVMQRLAAGHAAETTVSVVQLPADDMKGRIIGREGRNIRALEHLTGVDFIIDDTPNAVILSGFDGVRREIARMTLEKLLQDGRIHPARIEETYYQAKSELESHILESGEQAVLRRQRPGPRPRADQASSAACKYRTSYGQNVLAHSIECAHLAAMMADELGASRQDRPPRRAAARHRQGRLARDRGPARARRRRPRAPPRRVRGRRARDGGPPQRGRAADGRGRDRPGRRRAVRRPARARAASRSSSTSSACATSSRSRPATTASTRSTPCRPAARSA